jgi:hypothetical protein
MERRLTMDAPSETEEQIIRRAVWFVFGYGVVLTPDIINFVTPIYREYRAIWEGVQHDQSL